MGYYANTMLIEMICKVKDKVKDKVKAKKDRCRESQNEGRVEHDCAKNERK